MHHGFLLSTSCRAQWSAAKLWTACSVGCSTLTSARPTPQRSPTSSRSGSLSGQTNHKADVLAWMLLWAQLQLSLKRRILMRSPVTTMFMLQTLSSGSGQGPLLLGQGVFSNLRRHQHLRGPGGHRALGQSGHGAEGHRVGSRRRSHCRRNPAVKHANKVSLNKRQATLQDGGRYGLPDDHFYVGPHFGALLELDEEGSPSSSASFLICRPGACWGRSPTEVSVAVC